MSILSWLGVDMGVVAGDGAGVTARDCACGPQTVNRRILSSDRVNWDPVGRVFEVTEKSGRSLRGLNEGSHLERQLEGTFHGGLLVERHALQFGVEGRQQAAGYHFWNAVSGHGEKSEPADQYSRANSPINGEPERKERPTAQQGG